MLVATAAAIPLQSAPAGARTALAGAASHPLLGVTGNVGRFKGETGQDSSVDQAFLGWGQGQTFGSPFAALLPTLGPVPMIHLGTAGKNRLEAITPGAIAAGQGDSYLIALNQAIGVWGKAIYVRPLGEMNNTKTFYSGFQANGQPKDAAHSPASFRQAFARIYLILHGGSRASIDARLKQLGLAPLGGAGDLLSNPFPKLRIVWSPLAGGNPAVPGNAPAMYYPGARYVDVEGGDIYDEQLTDTAPWNAMEALYKEARGHGKPFSVPEWGLFGLDDPAFVQHMCTFLGSHGSIEMAGFYESRPGSIFDLEKLTKSRDVYSRCITPLAAPLPAWAAANLPGAGAKALALTLTPAPPTGSAPLAVKFAISARLSVPVAHWQLYFGDGERLEGNGSPPVTAAHSYKEAGIYEATLIVFDALPFTPEAARFIASAAVTAGTGVKPLVAFVPSKTTGKPPLAVSFRVLLALPSPAASWEIVFGDGTTRLGTGTPPRFVGHTYTDAATHRALLVVDSRAGGRYLASVLIGPGGGGTPPGATTTTTTTSSTRVPPATGTVIGTVLVNGRPFTGGTIPYGSNIDVTKGTLILKTDTGTLRVFGSGVSARFRLLRGTDNKKPIVELRLVGGNFASCTRKKASASGAAAAKPVRQLWGNGKGKFRTRGRYASATVRGTYWLTADRCDGTLVRVRRGVIRVLDLKRRKQVTVRAGKQYLVKP